MAGYAGGCITRVKMKNFMTYSDMEIYPKKGLNLIIGKNGSGKSSIMCAICLGLGGKPQFTGRSAKLSNFIKHGCKEAEVEIELESKKKNVVIRCKIKSNQCEWYLNRSQTNQNKVESVVKKFNIDTSSICQFCFQGQEFSQMNTKTKLENMLQAIGEPQLFKLFTELKDLHANISKVKQNVERCQRKKGSDEGKNRRIFKEVEAQEKRTRLKEELKALYKQKDICMKIEEYNEVRDEFHNLKKKVKTHSIYLKNFRLERDKAFSEKDEILNSYLQCSIKLKEYKYQKKELMNKLKHNSDVLTSVFEKVRNEKIEYETKLMEKQDQKKRLHDISKQIEGLELQLSEEANRRTDCEKNVQLNSPALAQLQSEINEVNQRIVKTAIEKNGLEYTANELKKQLTSLQDERKKKFKILERCDKPTYKAACWLKKKKNIFKCNVYLPIMFEIDIKSREYSKYIENVIGFRDMIAFVCEDKSDCERLTEILKNQMKLAVNIVVAPDIPMSSYELPPLTPEYRQCGLECFVKDLFSAPEPIMKYLCAVCGIHRIPVTQSVINSNNIEFILQGFRVFCFENTKEIKGRIRAKAKEFYKYNVDIAEKEKMQEILHKSKKLLLEQERKIKILESELLQKMNYRSLISVTFDEEVEKAKITRIMQSTNENKNRVISERNSFLMDFIQLEKEIIKLILKMNSLSMNFKIKKDIHQDISNTVKTAEIELQNLKKDFNEKKNYGLLLAAEILAFEMPHDPVLPVEDIEQKIHHIEVNLSFGDDNEHVAHEYNARKQKIDGIEHQIEAFENNLRELKQVIDKKKKQFLQPLQHHIENINKKFSYYFKHYFSSAGEISLDIPEDSDEFTKYGLQMKLKFRDTDEFAELTCRHSGGESSIAAVVFLLSLQGLRKVPFRCIDEFSQHMDKENEKKIYQLIFDNSKDRHSQYFLLTQELLLGFKYPDDVAVHIIFNSCFTDIELKVEKDLTHPRFVT